MPSKQEFIVCPSCCVLTQSPLGQGCRVYVCGTCKSFQRHQHIRDFKGQLVANWVSEDTMYRSEEFKVWRAIHFPSPHWAYRDKFKNIYEYMDDHNQETQEAQLALSEIFQKLHSVEFLNAKFRTFLTEYSR